MSTVDERSRRELYERLEAAIGPEGADTLMSMLPPVGWADVATKRDLDAQSVATERDLEQLRVGVQGEMATLATDLRTEMATLATTVRSELHGMREDVALLRDDVHQQVAGVRIELRDGLRDTTRTLFLGMLTAMLTMTGLFIAALALVR